MWQIFQFAHPNQWSNPLVLVPSATNGSPKQTLSAASNQSSAAISSLDWAPSSGRSFQLIAAGSRDGYVRIWKVTPPKLTLSSQGNLQASSQEDAWSSTLDAEIDAHVQGGGVGRVEFNITGTVLSTAGDDGNVRLWKQTFKGEWREHATLSCEPEPEQDEEMEE